MIMLFDFDAAELAKRWEIAPLYAVFNDYHLKTQNGSQELYGFLIGAIAVCNGLIRAEENANLAKDIQREVIHLAERLRSALRVPSESVERGDDPVPEIPSGSDT